MGYDQIRIIIPFNRTALKDSEQRQMFGKPCFKIGGKALFISSKINEYLSCQEKAIVMPMGEFPLPTRSRTL